MSFDLLTYWCPLALLLAGLAAVGVALAHPADVPLAGLAAVAAAAVVLLLALAVFLLGWGAPPQVG